MRTLGTLLLIALFAAPVAAQGNGRNSPRAQGIPPGQLPPPGLCRVWYEGRPPGQQPRPVNCDQAERTASRDRRARVIYGSAPGRSDRWDPRDSRNDRWDPRDDRNDRSRRGGFGYNRQIAFDNGARDGFEKGREDARDDDDYDPVRHSWYRSATRGYESRYGTREQYRLDYRDGFERGYAQGYRQNADRDDRVARPRGGVIQRWPN